MVPLSLIGIHEVGFPTDGAFVSVPALEPAPDVHVAVDVSAGLAAPGTATLLANVHVLDVVTP